MGFLYSSMEMNRLSMDFRALGLLISFYLLFVLVGVSSMLQNAPTKEDSGKDVTYINELILNQIHLGYVPNNNVTVTVTIRDAECFSSSTASSFAVHLAALDFDSHFQSWLTIQSEHFEYNRETGQRHFSGSFRGNLHGTNSLDECFEKLHIDCAPRADAVFIRFDNQPEDAWAIDQIFVDTSYRLGPTEEHEQKWHFEHPVLVPCSSWLDDTVTYQIGPRNGLFIGHNYRYNAEAGDWIRDWV
uniref:Oxidase/peroxidase n=1 Tax=Haemonchus contortus TaxID=6289 RepID=A0A7I4Z551_HAECO